MKPKFLRALLWACWATWAAWGAVFELEGVEQTFCPVSHEETSVRTQMMCAFRCRSRACTSFKFQDGICRTMGGGGDPDTQVPVKVYRSAPSLVNVALLRPTTASAPNLDSRAKENANDCNMFSSYHSAYGQRYAWWNVDLGQAFLIKVVKVYPNYHYSVHSSRFRGIEVSVGTEPAEGGNATSYSVIGFFAGPYQNSSCCSVDFTADPPIEARYVHLRRATPVYIENDFLIMKEVMVLV